MKNLHAFARLFELIVCYPFARVPVADLPLLEGDRQSLVVAVAGVEPGDGPLFESPPRRRRLHFAKRRQLYLLLLLVLLWQL